jgi:hypothetical protein
MSSLSFWGSWHRSGLTEPIKSTFGGVLESQIGRECECMQWTVVTLLIPDMVEM